MKTFLVQKVPRLFLGGLVLGAFVLHSKLRQGWDVYLLDVLGLALLFTLMSACALFFMRRS
jgi:hypothetical protein